MTDITIAAGGFPHYEGPSTGEIWIVANRPYTTPQGKGISANYVPESTFAIKVPFTVDGNRVLQVPQVVIDATEDSIDNPAATLGAYIMTSQGRPISVLSVFKAFKVSASPISTNWGQLAAHNAAVPLPVPTTPDAPVATAIDFSQVNVVLSAAAGAASYKLLRSANGGAFIQIAAGLNAGLYNDTTVSGATIYLYKAVATNFGGDSAASAASNSVTTPALTAPATPVITSLRSAALDVHLVTSATARAASYQIWRKTEFGGTYAQIATVIVAFGAALDYHDDTVSDGSTYYYKVKAVNSAGTSAFSNELNVAVSAPDIFTPVDPTALSPTSQLHYRLNPQSINNSEDCYPVSAGMAADGTVNAWGHNSPPHAEIQAPLYCFHGGSNNKQYFTFDDDANSQLDITQVGAESTCTIRDLVMTVRFKRGSGTLAARLPKVISGASGLTTPSEVWVDCVLTDPATFTPTNGTSYTIGLRWSAGETLTKVGGVSTAFDVYEICGFTNGGSPISDGNFHGVNQFLKNLYKTPRTWVSIAPNTGAATKQIVIQGDSHSSTLHAVYQDSLAANYPTASFVNSAAGGVGAGMQQLFLGAVPNLDYSRHMIATLWLGTNDLGNASPSGNGHVIWFRLKEYIYWLKRYGCHVVVLTSMKRGDGSIPGDFEAQRTALNTDILANTAIGYVVADVAARPHLLNPNDTAYFWTDKVHLQESTYTSDILPLVEAAIDTF
jgi:hypothetical protein